jgi:hypothetical protein
MKPNENFKLSVDDIELIERAFQKELNRLSTQRITHIESTIVPAHKIDSVKEIDAEVKRIRDLLGRLYHQKNFYRPKDKIYVGG